MDLPLGWHTDLAVLRLGGSGIEEYPDHLVVRTPTNPTYFWGNFVFVTDPESVDDAAGWLARFERYFPDAAHRSIGLIAEPADQAWNDVTMFIERADVLVATGEVARPRIAAGYTVRELDAAQDWTQSTRLRQAAFPEQDEFEQRVTDTRIRVTASGALTWFGAFAEDRLVAELGIALCRDGSGDIIARYQSVLTDPAHRRRGLTSHLLGAAAGHARDRGAGRLVIIADADTDSGRLYRAAGFAFDSVNYQVSRVPGIVPSAIPPAG
jgi:GNAT superfamily N-acetyltransferase